MTDLDQPLAPDGPAAPHSASGEQVATFDLSEVAPPARPTRRWVRGESERETYARAKSTTG
jgi:spore photoproduct lyase